MADVKELDVVRQALCRSKGTVSEAQVVGLVTTMQAAEDGTAGGGRARRVSVRNLRTIDAVLRRFVYGGEPIMDAIRMEKASNLVAKPEPVAEPATPPE